MAIFSIGNAPRRPGHESEAATLVDSIEATIAAERKLRWFWQGSRRADLREQRRAQIRDLEGMLEPMPPGSVLELPKGWVP